MGDLKNKNITAKANLSPVRQRTQYTCMATSMSMSLQALGYQTDEDEVNKLMGCRPGQGASWEDAIATAQHYGARCHLVSPATLEQVKDWTDQGIPVMIAWNPEGRDWSHASVIFDVEDDLTVHIADPNIPNPSETVRVLSAEEFYGKWFEKWPRFLFRRPAMAITREVDKQGEQVEPLRTASEVAPPKRVRLTSHLTPQDFHQMKMARREPSGLYGFTKATQKDCETCIRKLSRSIDKIARDIITKDKKVSSFLVSHAERSDSLPAKVLVASIRASYPKLATQEQTRIARSGLYGFSAKTVKIGLQACMDVLSEAGSLATDLHKRRVGQYQNITTFLQRHCEEIDCNLAKLLRSCYPEEHLRLSSETNAQKVQGGWLFWEE